MDAQKPRVAAIEAGGTKFIVNVGTHWLDGATLTVPTTTPEETLGAVARFIEEEHQKSPIAAIGIASFGPIDINPKSARYGTIGATPKPGWSDFSLLDALAHLGLPINVESDVNGAALAEARLSENGGAGRTVYVTVGTGIGAGFVDDGAVSNGFSHPEFGHILMPRHPSDFADAGSCPFHGHCLEGLACGPAIEKRWGTNLSELPPEHRAHEIEAYYLAVMCANLILSSMPDRILIGGGVILTPGLLDKVQRQTQTVLNGYLPEIDSLEAMQRMITLPSLFPHSGIAGAYLLAWDRLTEV